MTQEEKLTFAEIQCLQWHGISSQKIKDMHHSDFDALCHKHEAEFSRWIAKVETLFDRQKELGIKTISIQDCDYPHRLLEIGEDAPALIHLLGNTELLNKDNAVAIIGARVADSDGIEAAFRLGKRSAEKGTVVISGLALGCDKSAHEGCLREDGDTIAIVASGLNITHPRENIGLQQRILDQGGLLLSEQLIGIKANPTRLVARNRLQAALSHSVILAQCPEKSGSMHTMRFARKYGKLCFAVAYTQPSESNSGNRLLIESNLVTPILI